MIVLLNTSSAVCQLTLLFDDNTSKKYDWQADRTLAKNLLSFLKEKLSENDKDWADISAIGVFQGPGSFTGLRIGLTVMNTIANAENIPIVGTNGDDWQTEAIKKIKLGVNEKIVMPFYDGEAHITTSKK